MQIPKYTTFGDIHSFALTHYSKAHPFDSPLDLIRQMNAEGALLTSMPVYPDYPGVNDALSVQGFRTFIGAVPLNVTRSLHQDSSDYNDIFLNGRDISCLWYMPYAMEALHTHKYYEITYVFSGACCLLFENEKRLINAGNMVVITPSSRHTLLAEPDSIIIGILVNRKVFDDIISNLLSDDDLVASFFRHALYDNTSNYLNLSGVDLPPFRKNIGDIFFESTNQRKYNRACCLGFFTLLMACTLRRYQSSIIFHKTEPLAVPQNDFLYILEYMQHNFKTVTLASLAENFHYTPAYLCRLFKKNTHQNFSDALRDLKMQKALEYLPNPTLKITDIAELSGYDSMEHFSRVFKRCFGMSPLKYRHSLEDRQSG